MSRGISATVGDLPELSQRMTLSSYLTARNNLAWAEYRFKIAQQHYRHYEKELRDARDDVASLERRLDRLVPNWRERVTEIGAGDGVLD